MLRTRMTHRALIERNSTAADAYGNEQPGVWATLTADQACYYWQAHEARAEMQGDRNYLVYQHRIAVPLGTDVTTNDRINGITDRRGQTISSDVFGIIAIVRKPDHLLLSVEVIK